MWTTIATTWIFAGALLGAPGDVAADARVFDAMITEQFADLFEAKEYVVSTGPNQEKLRIPYRLFVPRNLKPAERCPLLLWLHGAGDGGPDNRRQLKYTPMLLKDVEHLAKYRFFILCPSVTVGWTDALGPAKSGATDANDVLAIVYELLQETMREQPVDRDRVYLTGICSGGNACWELAMRHPEVFAAMVPTTPGCGDRSRAARLANIPIWAFELEHPEGVKEMVDAVEQAGGNIRLTTAAFQQHDSWSMAFQHYDAMAWMLDQRRNAWICWTPPGHRAWRWWHILTVPSVFVIVAGPGWMSERRRRQ